MLSRTANRREAYPSFDRLRQVWMPAAVTSVAVLLGINVALEKWIFVGAVAALVLVLCWPVEASLGLLALMIPFDDISTVTSNGGTTGRSLTWFIGAATAFVLLANGLATKRLDRPPSATLWWGLFGLWATVTVAWAVDPLLVAQRLPTVAAFLLLYVTATSLRFTTKELRWVCAMNVLGGSVAAAYAAYLFYHGRVFASIDPRATVLFGERQMDPNFFAATLLLPISLAIGGVLSFEGWKRVLALCATAILGFGIFLSMSRGALLSLTVILVVFLFRSGKGWRLFVPLVALLPLTLLMPQTFFLRMQQASESGGAGRTSIWTAGFAALKHYGLFGAGLDNFPRVYTDYAGFAPLFKGFTRAPHSIYLGLGVEVGIVGLTILFAACFSQFRQAMKVADNTTVVAKPLLVSFEAACWSIMIAGIFLDVLWRKEFWFSWILLAAVTRVAQKSGDK